MGNLISDQRKKDAADLIGMNPNEIEQKARFIGINQNEFKNRRDQMVQEEKTDEKGEDTNSKIMSEDPKAHRESLVETMDYYLNGKNCLSCKVIATVNPLLMAAFVIYQFRKQKISYLTPRLQLATKMSYYSTAAFFVTMSMLSLTGSWSLKESDESLSDYIKRDQRTMVNQIRGLYGPKKEPEVKE